MPHNRYSWREILIPRDERGDPRFRAQLARLSVIGLRLISAVFLQMMVLWFLIVVLKLPEMLEFITHPSCIAAIAMFATMLGLSFWPPAQRYARLLGLVTLYLVAALDLWGSYGVPFSDDVRGGFLTGSATLILLMGIAVLPARPVQILALGAAMTTTYAGTLATTGGLGDPMGAASLALVVIAITVLVGTGLTAVVYHQRVRAYRARLAAEQSFEQLRETQGRLLVSRNAASQARFAAVLAHELNSPLGALTSGLATVVEANKRYRGKRKDRLDEVFDEAALACRESCRRLSETVDRMKLLTNLARAEEQIVDLNQLWTDTVTFLDEELKPKADIKLDFHPLPRVRCRPQHLSAVFSNLLRNAAAAMDGHGTIEVSSNRDNGELVLEVRDDGRGISAVRLEKLFAPSFQVEGARVATTNWGLFVSRSIVTEHGGHFEIESEEGRGTTARIRLPAPSAATEP